MIPKYEFGKALAKLPLVLALLGPLPGIAELCHVGNTNDDNIGSLRAAIDNNFCTSIVFALGSYPTVIQLTSGELLINRSLTITGPGAQNLTIRGTNARVFHITGASTVVTISGLTIRGATADVSPGGGIFLENATLTLTSSVVTENRANAGGGIFAVGGTLNLMDSSVWNNAAFLGGGGIGLSQQATLNLTNSTVYANRTLTASPGAGGGILVSNSVVNMVNGTIVGNRGTFGAGIYGMALSSVKLKNTLLAKNRHLNDQSESLNCGGNQYILSLGSNLSDDTTCTTLTESTDKQNTPAGTGTWGDNGGPTPTWALPAESPAVDAAACTDLNGNPVLTDQRGVPRPLGLGCDIGAFEFGKQVVIDIKPGVGPNTINLGSEGKITVAICSSPDFDPSTVDPYSITLAGASVALKGKALTPMASKEHLSVGACSLDSTYPDLVVHIDTQTAALTPGAAEAFLTGKTTATPPIPIFGKDSVQIVPPAN